MGSSASHGHYVIYAVSIDPWDSLFVEQPRCHLRTNIILNSQNFAVKELILHNCSKCCTCAVS